LAQRGEDPKDKRRVMVEITRAGRDFNAQKRMEVLGSMRSMLMQLGEADAREYVRLTRRAIEIMQAQREGGTP
jgi:DNA-binding MarR family transcriptional regulator